MFCMSVSYSNHVSYYYPNFSYILKVDKVGETNYYDSVTGKLLYMAPRGRTFEEFKAESKSHGWPSFRDNEVLHNNFE